MPILNLTLKKFTKFNLQSIIVIGDGHASGHTVENRNAEKFKLTIKFLTKILN